jgi:hypothetical protein
VFICDPAALLHQTWQVLRVEWRGGDTQILEVLVIKGIVECNACDVVRERLHASKFGNMDCRWVHIGSNSCSRKWWLFVIVMMNKKQQTAVFEMDTDDAAKKQRVCNPPKTVNYLGPNHVRCLENPNKWG